MAGHCHCRNSQLSLFNALQSLLSKQYMAHFCTKRVNNDVTDESLCGTALKCNSKNVAARIFKELLYNGQQNMETTQVTSRICTPKTGTLYNADVLLNIEEVVLLNDQAVIYASRYTLSETASFLLNTTECISVVKMCLPVLVQHYETGEQS